MVSEYEDITPKILPNSPKTVLADCKTIISLANNFGNTLHTNWQIKGWISVDLCQSPDRGPQENFDSFWIMSEDKILKVIK